MVVRRKITGLPTIGNTEREDADGVVDSTGAIDSTKVYDIKISEVSPDAAYIIHDPEKEINGDKIQLDKVLRPDLFKIIIESPTYQKAFSGCNLIKVLVKR